LEKQWEQIEGVNFVESNGLVWLDVQKPTYETLDLLSKEFKFHAIDLDDSISRIQFPKVSKYNDHIFMTLHLPKMKRGYKRESKTYQLSIFVGLKSNYLVTVHQEEIQSLMDLLKICKQMSSTQREERMGKFQWYLLDTIIDKIVDEDLYHPLMKIVGNIDDIEDSVIDKTISIPLEISTLRGEIVTLKMLTFPLKQRILEVAKSAISEFAPSEDKKKEISEYYEGLMDRIEEILAILERAQERIEAYSDIDAVLSTERTNRILTILTILTVLILPLTVIDIIYGMAADTTGPIYTSSLFGKYTPIIIIAAVSIVPPILMLYYFRKAKWLSFGGYREKIAHKRENA
jgi:magnesium transporter